MKKVLILGSTGSIGINALDVIKKFPLEFKIAGLTTNKNIDLLQKQINEFKPEIVAVKDKSKALDLNHAIKNKCNVLAGDEGILNISRTVDYDILISEMVGFAGFNPTIEGIKRGKRIALANKETLVAAGELVINLCKEHNADLIPIDSEHSALFQCMNGEDKREVEKIILTASGGPFLNHDMESLKNVTVTEALRHPTWDMGDKITIDSATMMNKGLEAIEAHWLFNLPKEKIKVIVHLKSIIHSMVEFIDGSIKAQLSTPDMRLPIQYALTYPYRLESEFVKTHLAKLHKLTFFEPDLNKFECLKLAYEVLEIGGAAPCILNAANEPAVDKFLKNKIKFLEIPTAIKKALNYFQTSSTIGLETIFECDRQTRAYINEIYN